jgi:hypothetical protein
MGATDPGPFGTYGGFACSCGSGTLEWDGGWDWQNPAAYNHKNQDGTVARCTPLPVCLTTCDPLVRCYRGGFGELPIKCAACPPGYVGSGFLAEGGCVKATSP